MIIISIVIIIITGRHIIYINKVCDLTVVRTYNPATLSLIYLWCLLTDVTSVLGVYILYIYYIKVIVAENTLNNSA